MEILLGGLTFLSLGSVGYMHLKHKKEMNALLNKAEKDANEQSDSMDFTPPSNLGVRETTGLVARAKKLEWLMNSEYLRSVKERILKKGLLTADEYDLYLLELQRYFLLTSFMKNVPMYNHKVDIIWHEMIMFTKSYQDFCHRFISQMIHHEPNTNGEAKPFEKELFELTYTHFFAPHNFTQVVYPHFQQNELSKEFLLELEHTEQSKLIDNYFLPHTHEEETILNAFITELKKEMILAKTRKTRIRQIADASSNRHANHYDNSSDLLLNSMIFHSLVPIEEPRTKQKDDWASDSTYNDTIGYAPYTPTKSAKSSSFDSNDYNSPSKSSCSSSSCSSSSCSSSSCSSSSSSSSCGSSCSS